MTTPSIDDINQAVAVSSAMRGCNCTPDVDIDNTDGITNVSIRHDNTCPAIATPDWN